MDAVLSFGGWRSPLGRVSAALRLKGTLPGAMLVGHQPCSTCRGPGVVSFIPATCTRNFLYAEGPAGWWFHSSHPYRRSGEENTPPV